jgi:flagellar hook-basal body complex protein FliE
MSIAPLGNSGAQPASTGAAGLPPIIPGLSVLPSASDFGKLLGDYMQQASEMQAKVGTDIEALAAGQTDNIQDVVLSAAQADLAVRMVIELRNRLVNTYQEVMRMQV